MSIKKTAIAVAVAGVMAAPIAQADVKVVGLISPSIDFVDTPGTSFGSAGTAMNTNQSSIGFKWSEDLGNGNKVIGFVDFSFDPSEPGSNSSRFSTGTQVVGNSSNSGGTCVTGVTNNLRTSAGP